MPDAESFPVETHMSALPLYAGAPLPAIGPHPQARYREIRARVARIASAHAVGNDLSVGRGLAELDAYLSAECLGEA